uniref:Uncharacterized protein n=1 Tax=Arundo donax TaxID=35708 RepID=A0A0A9EGJ7_ARUDO
MPDHSGEEMKSTFVQSSSTFACPC